MADKLKVSVPRMKEDGEGLKGCFEKIPNMVKDLDQSMAMLSTCWEGPAHATFRLEVEKDINKLLDLLKWIQKYLEALGEAGKRYGDCEHRTYDCINGTHI